MNNPEFTEEENKIISTIIEKHIREYTQTSSIYSADSLHSLRSKITDETINALGGNKIHSIDVLLNLEQVQDINFGFRINIKQGAPLKE